MVGFVFLLGLFPVDFEAEPRSYRRTLICNFPERRKLTIQRDDGCVGVCRESSQARVRPGIRTSSDLVP
jgi:hypothetical protein